MAKHRKHNEVIPAPTIIILPALTDEQIDDALKMNFKPQIAKLLPNID